MRILAHKQPSDADSKFFSTVIRGDFCIGCGACTAAAPGLKMSFTGAGRYLPAIADEAAAFANESKYASVCPFSDAALSESALADDLFGATAGHDPNVGRYLKLLAGFVVEGDFRAKGSSGGMATWLVVEMLNQGLVDGILHIRPRSDGPALFEYCLSRTSEDVRAGAKTRYYPIELSGVLQYVMETPGRYVLVGVPCFLKAVRLLAKKNQIINERIVLFVGLVCGHLKTAHFAQLLAWQAGIAPKQLSAISFREKVDGRKSTDYAIRASSRADGREGSVQIGNVFGADWGMGCFKLKACDYCDDVFAELADVTVGDAWLPQYENDAAGTNVIVVRNQAVLRLIDAGITTGRLKVEDLTLSDAIKSQRAGLAHRREGLKWRLEQAADRGEWAPRKRSFPDVSPPSPERANIYMLREDFRRKSPVSFGQALRGENLDIFHRRMRHLVWKYNRAYDKSRGFKFYVKNLVLNCMDRFWALLYSHLKQNNE